MTKIRFHLDENVDPVVAAGLRRYGIDVTTTAEVGLRSKSDPEQLAYVCQTKRVIITQDRDFLIIASQGYEHSGIAYCQKGSRSIGEIVNALILMYEVLTPVDMKGKIEFL
ncbi:DUF5615 domain-containing protein [Tumidithrix helvetica PCC 7403]|uniref:DUF5615 family PIN-like protein n=1 Tax=Tumidithrix helvetica TaxID=3457545 RepID=UPI003CB4E7F3